MPDAWRAMWLMVSYDLPVVSPKQRREEARFRKMLESEGYLRVNFSVYGRFCGSAQTVASAKDRIRRAMPTAGHVLMIEFTDGQWGRIEHLHRGNYRTPDPDVEQARPVQLKMF